MNKIIDACYLLLCLQCIICILNASLIGQEVEYTIQAITNIGNNLEGDVESSWSLRSILTIQSYDGYKVMQLNNVETGIYNGPKTDNPILLHPLETYLSVPFVVNYNESFWVVNSLSFNPGEPIWSRNIKKAVASSFQFKADATVDELVPEKNIFGDCRVKYKQISPKDLTIVKFFQSFSCRHIEKYGNPDSRWKGPNQNTTKKYIFSNSFSEFPLNISSMSFTTYETIINGKVKQQIEQRITVDRLSIKPTTNPINISECTLSKEPVFEIYHPEQQNIDLTLINKFNKEAKKFAEQLKLNSSEPINEDNLQTIGNLYDILATADLQNYTVQEFCELVIKHNGENSETNDKNPFQLSLITYTIVTSLIAYTGNDPFIIKYVKEVVTSNMITDIRAKLLAEFPNHLKNVNEELLEDLSKYLETNNDLEINNQFTEIDYSKMAGRDNYIISFSHLVARMYNYIINTEDYYIEESYYRRLILSYVEKYYQLYLETKYDSTKLSYILGLGNMGLLAMDRLLDIAKNRSESRHFRTVAMYSLEPTLQKEKAGIYTSIWPIVRDAGNPFELRVAALNGLLKSYIEPAEFYSIGWYLNQTSDEPALQHLYNYYITFLESHARIRNSTSETKYTYAYHEDKKSMANTKGLLTGFYHISTQDSPDNENFLSEMNLHVVANPVTNVPNIIRLNFKHKHDLFTTISSYSLHLKLEGIEHFIKFDTNDSINNKAIQTLLWMLKIHKLKPNFVPDNLHVEVILYRDEKPIFSFYSDNDIIDRGFEIYKYYIDKLFFGTIFHRSLTAAIQTYYYPSDLGSQIILNSKDEKGKSGNYDIERVETPEDMIKFFSNLQIINNKKIDLESQNALLNLTLGVTKVRSLQSTLNLNLNYSRNDNYFNWTDDDIYFDLLSEYKHAVYIDEVKDGALQNYCPTCKPVQFYNLSKTWEANAAQVRTWSNIIYITVDCTKISELNILPSVMQNMYMKNWAIPLAEPFVIVQYIFDYFYHYPVDDICSITVKTLPAVETPHWMKLQFTPFQKLNNSNFNAFISLTQFQKSDDKVINQYNISLNKIDAEINFIYFDDTTSKLQITNKIVSSPNISSFDDKFCLTPADPTEILCSIVYNNFEDTTDFLELDIHIKFSVTKDHERHVFKSKNYEICLKDSENSEITLHAAPPTRSCYLVCMNMSTYDNYTCNIIPRRISNRFNNIVKYITNQAQTNNISNVSLTYLPLKSKLHLNLNNDLVELSVNVPQYLQPQLLLKPQSKLMDQLMFGTLGLDSVCILTPQYIKTFAEETVESHAVTSFIGLIECHDKPRTAILIKKSYKKLDFKLWFDDLILSTKYMDSNTSNIVTEIVLNQNIDYENLHVDIRDQSITMKSKKINLYYNLDYLAITISSININKFCGVCSTGLLTATNYYSF